MYIGSTGAPRAAPSRLRGRRQLDRRGAGRLLRPGQRHDPHRQLGHGRGQRPRHPGRHARERQVGGRGRADRAPRRRQVRQRQLQGLRRPARRRRLGRQRALRTARSRNLAERTGSPAGVRARQAARRARGDRHHEAPGDESHLQARSADLRDRRFQLRHARAAAARAGVPERRRDDHASTTSGTARATSSCTKGASSRS